MSWELRKKAQALLALEQGGIVKDWGGKISVALVYPNTYSVGMSNLGFQSVYRLPWDIMLSANIDFSSGRAHKRYHVNPIVE